MPDDTFQEQLLNAVEDLIEAIEKQPAPREVVVEVPPAAAPTVEVRVPESPAPSVQVDSPVTVNHAARAYKVDKIERDGQNFIKSFTLKPVK